MAYLPFHYYCDSTTFFGCVYWLSLIVLVGCHLYYLHVYYVTTVSTLLPILSTMLPPCQLCYLDKKVRSRYGSPVTETLLTCPDVTCFVFLITEISLLEVHFVILNNDMKCPSVSAIHWDAVHICPDTNKLSLVCISCDVSRIRGHIIVT